MKLYNTHIAFLLLLIVLLLSCKENHESKTGFQTIEKPENLLDSEEKFESLDFSKLNMELIKRKDDPSPEDIMKSHYPNQVEGEEGNEQISIITNVISEKSVEVKLIHENLLDDSLNGVKHILRVKRVGARWMIVSLKKNWKCWEGRGHTNWGIEKCK
jgi:hypothetical protein